MDFFVFLWFRTSRVGVIYSPYLFKEYKGSLLLYGFGNMDRMKKKGKRGCGEGESGYC